MDSIEDNNYSSIPTHGNMKRFQDKLNSSREKFHRDKIKADKRFRVKLFENVKG